MARTASPANFDAVRDLVGELCDCLDREDFAAFLERCHPDFQYEIRAYSPELRRDMTWFCQNRSELSALMAMLPEQVRIPAKLLRHVSVRRISAGDRTTRLTAESTFVALRTAETGETSVLACGKYFDEFVQKRGVLTLIARTTVLDTRDLGQGIHVPI